MSDRLVSVPSQQGSDIEHWIPAETVQGRSVLKWLMKVSKAVGCADKHTMGGCFYCLWQVKSSTASQTDNSIWVLAQLELDVSEIMATWIAEAMQSFCIWIWWTYWPKGTVFKSRPPGSAGVCWRGSSTIAIYREPDCLLWMAGERDTLCIWEGAALVKEVAGQQPAHSPPPQGPLQPIFLFLRFSSGNWGQQRISYNCLPGPPARWPQIPSGSKHLTKLGGAEVGMSSCQFPGKGNTWLGDHQQKSLLPAERNEQPRLISSCS